MAIACAARPAREPEPAQAGCQAQEGDAPDFLRRIGCREDFERLASEPLDASIPGARAVKLVIDRLDGDALYFQNSRRYRVHWEFASKHLSGGGRPIVPPLARFNQTEYSTPGRRFLLGSVTHYERLGVWAFAIAPYDTASAEMIARAFDLVARATYFGDVLVFHATSAAVEREAARLPPGIRVTTNDALFAAIDYQPLNLASAIGRLRFLTAADLERQYLSFRDIVVLDRVPNDISVTSGIVTEEFQTPLAHINVLAQNRRIPNMALRGAHTDPRLRALEGRWVRLSVRASDFSVEPATLEEADAWWEAHRPRTVQIPRMDTSVRELRDVEAIVDPGQPLAEAIRAAVPSFGGKAAHYGALAASRLVPMPKAFAIPVHHYARFLAQNGLDRRIDEMLADPVFRDDPAVRDRWLDRLSAAIRDAPVDPAFEKMLLDKIAAEHPGVPLRFRSSTNAEDLDGFTGAGLYTSKTGHPGDPDRPVLLAVKRVWASVWRFRAFEERAYRGIDHRSVGMAILVHRAFPDEGVTGVALTANPFDPTGLQPGFFINAQVGAGSVTLPDAGVKADQFVYHFELPGRPMVFLERSSLIPRGTTVMTPGQVFELGNALAAIHRFFRPVYGPPPDRPRAWYGLEVDFKFDGEPGQEPALVIKQARPHPGRGDDP